MKSYSLSEIRTVEQVAALTSGTLVYSSNVDPKSWRNCNPSYTPILHALESRAPLGWEHVQLDGICRYDLIVSDKTATELLDERARLAGYRDSAELLAELADNEQDAR